MNSKKLISVVLSALLLITGSLGVFAKEPEADVAITVLGFDVQVTVTTEAAAGRMTAILRDKANTIWIDMDQATEYTQNADGLHTYSFSLVMRPDLSSGTYTVTVGGNVKETAEDFEFTSVQNIVNFYNSLNSAAADDIYGMLTGEDYALTYDLTAYKALSEELRAVVDAEIAAWDLATSLSKISATEAFFASSMDHVMNAVKIIDAEITTEEWMEIIQAAVKNETLEVKYLKTAAEEGEEDTSFKASGEAVHAYFIKAGVSSVEDADIQTGLDEAQLLAVAKEADYGLLGEAFAYYLDKGILDIDDSIYSTVSGADKTDSLFKAISAGVKASAEIDTIEELEALADNEGKKIVSSLTYTPPVTTPSGSGSSSSSSSGSSGSGGSIGGRNTTGNTMLSGNAADAAVPKSDEVAYDADFSDLDEAAWAASAITALAEKGIVSGRGDGKYYPNDIVTREEFVKIVVVAFDALEETAAASFDDVAQDRWSYPYIASANRLGLVTGLNNSTFNPTGTITREDMAVIMHRAAKRAGIADGAYDMSFTDADEIADYALEAVNQLAGRVIINGMGDGTFAPKGTVTRAQAAKVVYELLALIGGVN